MTARNEGYLPTHITEQTLKMKTAVPVEARICIGPNDKLLAGKNREEIGHLAGYGGRHKVEWIVHFAEQLSAKISVACPRAGTARLDLADALTT